MVGTLVRGCRCATSSFPQVGGNRVAEAPEVIFNLSQGDEVVKTPPPNDSLKASLSPPVGGLHFFRRDWQTNKCSNNMSNILTIHHQSKLARVPLIHSGYKTATVHVSSPRPKCLGHRCSKHKLIGPHSLCLPSNGSPSQDDLKYQTMQLPDHCNSPRLARDALVLGPSAALNKDPTSATSVNNSSQTVPQLCVSQQSTTSQPPRLVSTSGQLQEQGFSVEVAERIAAPQRSSTRTIYKSKWALFEKWCRENSVDFSTPSVKQVLDFFMYL